MKLTKPTFWGAMSGAESITRARAAAKRAVELDDSLAEAHASLAEGEAANRQWTIAEREYRRAIELNQDYATGHQWFGTFLSA